MKPLIVLIAVFCLALLVLKWSTGHFDFALAARIAMSVMLFFTASAHFAFSQGMEKMLPDFVPFKTLTVYATGLLEILFAIALLLPNVRVIVAWSLIVFFILILPANIFAAIKHINYQTGATDGSGLPYLWFRVPLQILFIAWTYFSSIKN